MNIVLKEFLRRLLRHTLTYSNEKKRFFAPLSDDILEEKVIKAISNVPYYKDYKSCLSKEFSIKNFPILQKSDLIGNEEKFVSKKKFKLLLRKIETGGTTGESLRLYYNVPLMIKENVSSDYAFSFIGDHLRIAVFRGIRPSHNKIYQDIGSNKVIFSAYALNDKNIEKYIQVLNDKKINCLHVYPSVLLILIRLIKNKYDRVHLPYLKGIITSSEVLPDSEKKLISQLLPDITLVNYYGLSELCCAAVSINQGYFKFNNTGYVELIDTGNHIHGNNSIAKIIATSIMNDVMPLIRYDTEDYAEVDPSGNIVSIIGRKSDFLINDLCQPLPCIYLNRNSSFRHVKHFQYNQSEIGKLVFKVSVTKEFNNNDKQLILKDLKDNFSNMECNLEIVDDFLLTEAGKFKRVIQELDISKYIN